VNPRTLQTAIAFTEMEHPPHSPDLSPNDFWLFPEIKFALKGRGFQDIEDVRNKDVTTVQEAVPMFPTVAASLG
jgi:hypothetical protein